MCQFGNSYVICSLSTEDDYEHLLDQMLPAFYGNITKTMLKIKFMFLPVKLVCPSYQVPNT